MKAQALAFASRFAETVRETICRHGRVRDEVWRVLMNEHFARWVSRACGCRIWTPASLD